MLQHFISFSTLENYNDLVIELEKHLMALELLAMEITEPRRDQQKMDCIYGLLWDRVSYLEQTVSELQAFYSAVFHGREFGQQEE
ncbi:MAG: hypothetical protein J6J43_06665 [Oscillospiraceae bacterium]|nr:hypothetical protein [Oscillospiraceae bacterium]